VSQGQGQQRHVGPTIGNRDSSRVGEGQLALELGLCRGLEQHLATEIHAGHGGALSARVQEPSASPAGDIDHALNTVLQARSVIGARIQTLGVDAMAMPNVRLLEPLSYLEMVGLTSDAALVITDSGGLQEETTWLGVPCVTVRPNTERPITCAVGTNRLVAPRREAIRQAVSAARALRPPSSPVIERWDGRAGERIAAVVCDGARFD